MNKVETESFLKSFFLFFTSLSILIGIVYYVSFSKSVQTLDESILSQMRLCSYDLKCEQFKLDFIDIKEEKKLSTLYKNENGLTSYYPIPNSENFLLSFNLSQEDYLKEVQILKEKLYLEIFAVLVVVFLLSVLFSIYSLYPLRNALLLTQEFIKDILHDFNTPLATLRLNSSMLKNEIGTNDKVQRIELGVKNILDLQEHLRSYLQNSSIQKEEFDLKELIQTRIDIIQINYPDIKFFEDIKNIKLFTNKEAFTRVIDNLLSNAAKYNKQNGSVKIVYEENSLKIIDTGKGIKNPKKIFNRFYKEQERGLGIGLHIVKKLCEELGINIQIESELNKGTVFMLNLSKLTTR
ncbi:HAMP domain-containing histidine kinase [Sulfurimonas lithotrophica]|uniref:histidine kinase n=1 Tax=Sulfurimonas lithotrophica TaxID=2590022 RepID=A0A5P8P3S0_9BACT|nr:HAMP domain-containing sensor histidine kinase [Sulfurimonas lithotrophica]QFR50180.1 HAMP domain-containing histidine kinase [Sulfurimonas lithotrophica]